MKIISTSNGQLSFEDLNEVANALREGAVVAFPTETVYGIGCAADKQEAIDAIYAVKNRDSNKPMSLHISTPTVVSEYIASIPSYFSSFMDTFWPGPVTAILRNAEGATIGFRYPDCPVALELIDACGGAIFATSGNVSGSASPKTAQEVMDYFGEKIDYVIDDGPCREGNDSTVLLMEETGADVLREGAWCDRVRAFFESLKDGGKSTQDLRRVVFVCTGNTCRSPMGEAWLQSYLESIGKADSFYVESCGVHAYPGMTASQGAVARLKQEGIDLSNHRAQAATKEIIKNAYIVFCMSYAHRKAILDLVPEAEEKVVVLNVGDPIGFGNQVYDECFQTIVAGVKEYVPEILKGMA